ncbi:uncharacterized protein LOC142295907 [Anomaloglossus baeobatrachus]|uniref:uncharacterized protein LOC142295907 n=1 Tax=Anomaloglossus baeobatrachus TaxID=238106 RepID=UPI003F507F1C
MEQDREHMAARILDLTLEIIYWITGEDHTVVKTSSGECVTPRVSGGRSRTPSAITEPPPHSLIHEQKILELTHRITELLSGEVPMRCQDVTVYFSMEEWEYLEGHKDLYKEVMMEEPPSITSPDGSSQRNPPERSPRPLYSQDRPEKEEDVPRDHQVDEVFNVGSLQENSRKMTRELENSVTGKKGTSSSSEHHNVSLCYEVEDNNIILTKLKTDDEPAVLQCIDLSSDIADHWIPSSDQSLIQLHTENRGKNVENKYNLTLSQEIVTDEQTFSCSECGKCFKSEIQLKRHKETHTEKKPYSCPECGKCFDTKTLLQTHLRIHTEEKPFPCPKCGKSFKSEFHLKRHKTETHTEKKPHSCSECGKCFKQKHHLSRHLISHTGEKPFPCPKCGKCFKSEFHLKRHKTETHTEKKPYSCSECGKCFKQKHHLSGHLITHIREKPFPCPECGKCFKSEIQLKKHREIHTEEKPCSCPECGKCFNSEMHLKSHKTETHTEKKPYSCPECAKCFKQKRHLSTHLKIHIGEKAFLCPECGKSFSRKTHILAHLRSHTGEKPFLCTDCGTCFAHKSNLDRHKKSHKKENGF